MSEFKYVGKDIPRVDAWDKVTGRGMFTQDVSLPGMLYTRVLRSPYAHAKVVSIDLSEAEKLPGVAAVAYFGNTTRKLFNPSNGQVLTMEPHEPAMDMRLFTDEPKYIGDEIAAVAAVDEKTAQRAVSLIKITYRELPFVLDPLEALKEDAPAVQPVQVLKNVLGQPAEFKMGDTDAGFAEADLVVEDQVRISRLKHAQLETQCAVADYRDDGRLKVVSTTQSPHNALVILSHLFEIPESRIEVCAGAPYVGGGFGTRTGFSGKAEAIAAALSMLARRPVKYSYTREEDMTCSDSRHGGYITGRLGVKKDGTFCCVEVTAYLNIGAYATYSMDVLSVLGAYGICSTYHIPNLHYMGYGCYTNQQNAGAFRGFGTPQGTFMMETLVDHAAKELGMDGVILRKMNSTKVGDTWILPYPVGSTGLNECIDKAAAAIGWKAKRGGTKTGHLRRGIGLAAGTHGSNAWPFCVDYSSTYARIENDGSLFISVASPEIGPGSTTSMTQIAAESMHIPIDMVRVRFGETASAPFDSGTHATRTLYTVGNVIHRACLSLVDQVLEYAQEQLGIAKDRLKLEDGMIRADGGEEKADGCNSPDGVSISLAALAHKAHLNNRRFLATVSDFIPNTPPWECHGAEVEVDMQTGMVRVVRMVCAHDVGRAINPLLVKGQIEGGVVMGIGGALREEMSYVEGKGFYNDGFHKYMLPAIGDIPEIVSIIVESCDPTGPYNLKGVGECSSIPTAAAIASAVEDATGVRFHELPMTPGRVLQGLKEAGKI
ncbi:xanthine dehydrogenase family protein molybdopterin-binding subunit [Enterocloster asparagiformis]|uniref:xanthine dehydrogenase family protein molybdopterin-binding subunit n=1 Tax=Enterocloster asparagiformis TaxID=333367 RepID=UPI002A8330A1|nr:molybdopterin cofactor-binding domain-containing protein [Enterocloster asparagiformis]